MALHERILKGVKDDSLVLAKAETRGPLHELIDAYMVYAIHDDQLPNITVATTGRELKDALELLEPDIELELLKKYSDAQTAILYPHLKPAAAVETAEVVAKRNLRHWLIKWISIVMLIFFLGGIGAVTTIGYRTGHIDNKLITVFVSFAGDIAKLIFSIK